MSIDDALAWAKFTLVNSESALLDAQVLLAFVLEKETVYLMTWPERELSQAQKSAFEGLISQRVKGVPVAHLTGAREFWSLPLKVNNSTLIPRPDTELLVEAALDYCSADARILDLGTGSGAIILALASELPDAYCLGVDVNESAVQLAIENGKNLKLNNVHFQQSNWFDNINGLFDVVVSNPPYIEKNDHHLKLGDVRFEPLSALVADENGLADIRKIAQKTPEYLKKGGYLLVEHGFNQGSTVRELFTDLGYSEVITIKDYGDNDRVTMGLFNQPNSL
ncbi:[protein release factor]-glutamine N5-methyltransferase [Psychromonas ingrahamii 37]|uniref:Release factor glutamine methyltransferase n=1 Tax=Psychromonas ingrahamii (strain DSM 17664 / CCUG 51855 / 37) TaxID=357804 RepID=A1SV90_PSYIN|nr:peptide chain release factor N(5)-glutamine methyltransferase [Psychromonas ingrahamii]ABM03405.1 [protein release factor]-glutamine N5-methyltransferase [Psychromonas ingrahamii 37]